MLRSTAVAALATAVAGALAGCESTPEPPQEVAAAQAVLPDQSGPQATLVGNTWQPVDFTGCPVPWGLAVMVENTGILQREFTFGSNGSISVRQVESPRSPETADTFSLAYTREGSTLRIRAGLGVDSWTIRELTTARLLVEDVNGQQCWLRRVG
ncbi:hypothetical protein [Cryptosporangium minutisporangium]|uniref:Lipoprotein n=1 Tax=Cryptosporangium minutisporangium TaxID=113569 RepID=A0ABP6T3V6_9ACTN